MVRRTYDHGLRLESGTRATGDAENPWLDDQTTTLFQADVAEALALQRIAAEQLQPTAAEVLVPEDTEREPTQSLLRTTALPRFVAASPAAGPLVPAPRSAAIKQRADAALASFWQGQSPARRTHIMSRVFDPTWVRALAATVGITMCVVFGWVLVAGPELPSLMPKMKTLASSTAVAASSALPEWTSADAALRAAAAANDATLWLPLPSAAAASSDSQLAAAGKRGNDTKNKSKRGKALELAHGGTELAEPASEAAGTGGRPATLRINSRPWSDVFIDDKSVGPTPQLSISLQPGVHNVRLHNRQLNLLKILTLHVLPGETIDRVELLDP